MFSATIYIDIFFSFSKIIKFLLFIFRLDFPFPLKMYFETF